MSRKTLPLMLGFLAVAGPLAAQSWTSEQREVMSVIEAQWAATMQKDANWADRFLHAQFLGWSEDTPTPRGKDSTAKWSRYDMENSTTLAQELVPIGIVVHGNTAVAHYFFSLAIEDREAKRRTEHGRYTDVLVREDGQWRFLAWRGGAAPGTNAGN